MLCLPLQGECRKAINGLCVFVAAVAYSFHVCVSMCVCGGLTEMRPESLFRNIFGVPPGCGFYSDAAAPWLSNIIFIAPLLLSCPPPYCCRKLRTAVRTCILLHCILYSVFVFFSTVCCICIWILFHCTVFFITLYSSARIVQPQQKALNNLSNLPECWCFFYVCCILSYCDPALLLYHYFSFVLNNKTWILKLCRVHIKHDPKDGACRHQSDANPLLDKSPPSKPSYEPPSKPSFKLSPSPSSHPPLKSSITHTLRILP